MPSERSHHDDHTGHDPHHGHRARAEASDDRNEHDGHRTGWSRHLHVGAAEHRGHESGDDRGDQSGLRAEARGDAEPERERKRDDTDGHAGDDIAAPATCARPRSRRGAGASRARLRSHRESQWPRPPERDHRPGSAEPARRAFRSRGSGGLEAGQELGGFAQRHDHEALRHREELGELGRARTSRRRSSPPCAWSPDPRGAAPPAAVRGATTRCRRAAASARPSARRRRAPRGRGCGPGARGHGRARPSPRGRAGSVRLPGHGSACHDLSI